MVNIFDYVPRPKIKRSYQDDSHSVTLSCDMGKLIPVLCKEVLPGEKVKQHTGYKVIMSPMVAPIMHDVNVRLYSFFVPSRLLTPNWETFIAGFQNSDAGDSDPDTGSLYALLPGIDSASLSSIGTETTTTDRYDVPSCHAGTLWDYFGLPPIDASSSSGSDPIMVGIDSSDSDLWISELPFRAYQRVWDEWFRNESIEGSAESTYIYSGSAQAIAGPNNGLLTNLLQLRGINWEKDYFTSALPWPQRGPTVYIPGVNPADPEDGTIGNLAIARALKRFLDTAARAGNRLKEHLFGHWGVNNRDERLQRSEFITGSSAPLIIGEVLQTSSTDDVSPQGNPSGRSLTLNFDHKFTHYCPEDGYILTLMAVVPKPVYQQGIHRMFKRRSKFDYALPEFVHLPEQEITSYEVAAPWIRPSWHSDTVFGYTGRYNEYRYLPNRVAGVFRSLSQRDSLSYWTMARDFTEEFGANKPVLSSQFVRCTPTGRIFSVSPQAKPNQSLWFMIHHSIIARKPIPKHGIGKY